MKIGLALAGGGIRGTAHIGAIKALEENGIEIEAIGGTSAGSIVAALYAMGYKTDEIIKLFREFSSQVLSLSPRYIWESIKATRDIKLGGITTSENIEKVVEQAAKKKNVKNIKDLKMPITIPATDLISNKEIIFTNNENLKGEEYIHDIEIGKAVRASSTFPGMYAPFEHEKYQFVDGGIFSNLPVKETKELGIDKVLALRFKLKSPRKQKTIYNITMQSLDLMTENLIRESVNASTSVLEIDLREVKPFNIKKLEFCYKEGYLQTLDNILRIKRELAG